MPVFLSYKWQGYEMSSKQFDSELSLLMGTVKNFQSQIEYISTENASGAKHVLYTWCNFGTAKHLPYKTIEATENYIKKKNWLIYF